MGYQNPEPFVWFVLIDQFPHIYLQQISGTCSNQNKPNKRFRILVSLPVITFWLIPWLRAVGHSKQPSSYTVKRKLASANSNSVGLWTSWTCVLDWTQVRSLNVQKILDWSVLDFVCFGASGSSVQHLLAQKHKSRDNDSEMPTGQGQYYPD